MYDDVRCFGPLFYNFTFNSFFHIEQKNMKYAISPLKTAYKIPDILLTLLKVHQLS